MTPSLWSSFPLTIETGRGRALLNGQGQDAAKVKSSPIFGVPLPQQPALQLIYDTAPIGLLSFAGLPISAGQPAPHVDMRYLG
jgi:hypothetical protein